jgi:methylated-DNA-[protein]-cysteine S-methyltransferase
MFANLEKLQCQTFSNAGVKASYLSIALATTTTGQQKMKKEYKAYYQSEIGLLEIVGSDEYITALNFISPEERNNSFDNTAIPKAVADCVAQLDEYFKGKRQEFDLKLEPEGTEFQRTVWRQLTSIPFGKTVSYLDIAKAIGNEKAVRAVGAANGKNPISIVVPCHRIIGSNGQLTGYGGGLWRKAWLLKHEGSLVNHQMKLF